MDPKADYFVPSVIEQTGRGERAYDIYSRLLKDQLTLTQHDLKLAQRDLEKYADEYAGLVAEKDEEIEKLKAEIATLNGENDKKLNTLKAGEPGIRFVGKSIPLHPYYQTAMDAMEKEIEELKAEKRPINFDDANYAFYWAAADGDVIFWKVPCELHDLTEEDGETCRVLSAFMRERFGDEWGCLSSHTVRTMTLEILEENE
jgi:uncharacterized small protein (DUF1192 family)